MSFSQCDLANTVYVLLFFRSACRFAYSVRLLGSPSQVVCSCRLLASFICRALDGYLIRPAGVASEGLTGYNSDACRGHDGPLV